MQIAFLLFDDITPLDAIGPYEVLSNLPGAKPVFVGKQRGVYRTGNRALGLTADAALDEVTDPDVLVVPGGFGNRELICAVPSASSRSGRASTTLRRRSVPSIPPLQKLSPALAAVSGA